MSALAGAVWPIERPATLRDAETRLRHLSYRGSHFSIHIQGSAALGVALHDASADARVWVDADAQVAVTFDGRLDDRERLCAALGCGAPEGDVGLVGRAYAKWGTDLGEHLRGDFALVVWDERVRRLLAVRDIMGIRPFAYRAGHDSIAWASDPHALARDADVRINEAMVGEVLCADAAVTLDETLFEGVRRLPPAHALTWRDGVMRVWQYWTPRIDRSRWTRSHGELADELRTLISDATRARTRGQHGAAVMLSGGIDSSVVTAAAVGVTSPSTVTAFSMHVSDPPISERPFFDAVSSRLGIGHVMGNAREPGADYFHTDAARFLDLPESPGAAMAAPLRQAIRDRGHQTVLTGIGGDEWFFGTQLMAADYLATGQWRSLARRLAADVQLRDEFSVSQVIRLGVWLQFSEQQKQRLRRIMRLKRVPPWIRPSFAAAVGLEDRLRPRRDAVDLPTHEARETFYAATAAPTVAFREANSRMFAGCGLEDRHPLHDRALIEFALSLPPGERLRAHQPKWILRQAYAHELPENVITRGAGPDYSFAAARAIEQLGGAHGLEQLLSRDPGRLEPHVVRRMMHDMSTRGHSNNRVLARTSWPLWLIFALDCWHSACAQSRVAPRAE